MQPSEEIKSRLDIVDVIKDYLQLKQAGANFTAPCPFHREKSPSFMVSPEKQIWHCFGCGKGGDLISFVMEIEGVDFMEALKILAPKAGVNIQRQDPAITSKRHKLMDVLNLSKKYYHKVLMDTKPAEPIREYLKKRGLTEETIEEWQIGYSFDIWEGLSDFLKKNGYNEKEIFAAGMSAKSNSGSKFYDRFRGRIMFPIDDVNGNTVAFSARLDPTKEAQEKMGKYINSPQTELYDKSRILFGLDKAKSEIRHKDMAIVVEGQMDVISAHQAGYKNVVASSGTALTDEQINLIKRYTKNIALAFDMDSAGVMAADRGIRESMSLDMNIKVIELPEGKDPDECIKNNLAGWKKAVENAKPMMQYYIDKTFTNLNINNIDDQKKAKNFLLPIIAKLRDRVEQDFWLRRMSQMMEIGESAIRDEFAKLSSPKRENIYSVSRQIHPEIAPSKPKSREDLLSQLLLSLIIKFPFLLEYSPNNMQAEWFMLPEYQYLYKKIVFYYNNTITNQSENKEKGVINYANFRKWLESEANSETINNEYINDQPRILDKLVILGDNEFFKTDTEEAKVQFVKISSELRKYFLNNRKKELTRMIALAESEQDENKIKKIMEEFKILSQEINNVE